VVAAAAGVNRRFVFDFAGVVFNWQPLALLQQVMPSRATDEASAHHWAGEIFQGYTGDWADFDRGTVEPDALVARIAARTGLGAPEVQAVVDAVPLALRPVPDTVALLRRLRQPGRPMFYLSNMPASYADHLERCNPFLAQFEDGVISARVQLIKPEPAIFELAARRFGVAPAELVFFDDVPANVVAAQAAGWQAFVFINAAQCERDIRQAGLWPADGD